MIRLEDVSKIYRMGQIDVAALRGVSLEVEAGEMVAIMGTSGSGKSTMMNLLGCLDRPTTGRVVLDGTDVSRLDRAKRAQLRGGLLGFVFQSFNLLARTSALENVELPMIYARVPARERHVRATEALTQVGLGDRLSHEPSQLSGGQQQRVAIARALVRRPRLVLADEPTGNLDSRSSAEVMALLRGLTSEGITVVLVTHEPDVAACAERVVLVKDGLIASDERRALPPAMAPLAVAEARP
jgi:putative ABC transport system ATP-binding protein